MKSIEDQLNVSPSKPNPQDDFKYQILNECEEPCDHFLKILRRSTDLLNDDPIREEVFSIERLELYAAYLAGTFTLSPNPKRNRSILKDLKQNGRQLLDAYLELTQAFHDKEAVSPAAEWFVDNFHIVEDQLREIKQDLPNSYYDELPKLSHGELAGRPRVYAIALAIIAHTDSRLDAETLKRFLRAFQQVVPLTIGELWATAITLRIALVERLKPLALRIVRARQKRAEADAFADQLLHSALSVGTPPQKIVSMFIERVGDSKQLDRAFIVQLIQRLRDQDPDVLPALDWLEIQLREQHNTTIQAVIQLEHNRQATAQVTVGNIITSMRLLSALDWREFIESVSLVDSVLCHDPVNAYPKMDFATRDRYRHMVERLAKRSKYSELDVAERVLETAVRAHNASTSSENSKRTHVGYYLIGDGSFEFEKLLGYRPQFKELINRWVTNHATFVYLGSLSLFMLLLLFPVFKYFKDTGGQYLPALCFITLALLPASEFALSILNHILTLFIKPKLLPKLDTEKGIPAHATTMVVIPTLFSNAGTVHDLLEKLQVHYLSNRDPHIYFALLGDYADADQEVLPEDKILYELAERGIGELNPKNGVNSDLRFFLFHRKRLYNPSEGKWMGYERKRGKLHEFNRLLRGAHDTSFIYSPADPVLMASVKYVITLDSDTELPRGSAHQLIGTALHPLNQPEYDVNKGRVVSGYGILQPRISVALLSANKTHFSHLFSGAKGLDSYTIACSDVYQDLFGEGSYTGKGLYEVDIFEKALANRIPENTVLSHDLFEGCFARSALVSDVELFDDYPADYEIYSKRQHRWIRGDWQIAPWIFPSVATADSKRASNKLSLIARWKILDNLRRSLVPASVLLWLWLAWVILPGAPFLWTLFIVVLFAFPISATVTSNIFNNRQGISWHRHMSQRWTESGLQARQILVMLAFMPNQAWNQTDAICRTLYRKFVSHKKLLEWTTFAAAQHDYKRDRFDFMAMAPGPIFAMLTATTLYFHRPLSFEVATPFLLAWLTNPFLKKYMSQRTRRRIPELEANEIATFRLYARKTWHFFETFVTEVDSFLAPDNFQEEPVAVVAHRTSPTNIGIHFLSMSSASDFGYVGRMEIVELAEKTFASLSKLERLHGHFYNWYDTQTLQPLRPQYISTVDSGNLAGHLLAFKQFIGGLRDHPQINAKAKEGLVDTLKILDLEAYYVEEVLQLSPTAPQKSLHIEIESILAFIVSSSWDSDTEFAAFLETIQALLAKAHSLFMSLSAGGTEEAYIETGIWLNAAIHLVSEFSRDLKHFSDVEIFQKMTTMMNQCDEMVLGMDFKFLFDEERKMFVIGYNVSDHRVDNSYYDLLASESRLASFVAIAKGDVPQEHWFRLGRQLTAIKGGRALISWTGTMFEYLMPLLVTRNYEETLLDQTYHSVVASQIDYGKKNKVPWGISESEYNTRDLQLMFQYRSFGIPGLGLKRGLSDDLVISPYSAMLAAVINPKAVLANLKALEDVGALSRYGFYEAIDYTPERLKKNQKFFILQSFMAHHQGMSLVSMNNLIHRNVMQRRFHSEPLVQATQLLLQERIPHSVPIYHPRAEEVHSEGAHFSTHWNPSHYSDVNLPTPRTQLLSNGNYSIMLTTAGSGYSRCGPYAVTRWREDVTRDQWGQFFYIRNLSAKRVWSSGYQPTGFAPRKYEVTLDVDKVEFWREDGKTSTHTEITVSSEEDVEVRRITLTNNSDQARDFEITSFMEIVLAPQPDDLAHPAFSNLFVQTEFLQAECALLAHRRLRSLSEAPLWAFHVLVIDGETLGSAQYETDRAVFLGRGRNPSNANVIEKDIPLSNTVGNVLDPIFSLRQKVRIPAGEVVKMCFSTGVAKTREEALRLIDKYHDTHIFNRCMEMAWTASRVQLRHLNIDSHQTHTYQRLASRIIYSDPSLRPRSEHLKRNTKSQAGLWLYGISGDLPIVLVRVSSEKDISMVRELLHAHEYLRLKGLVIDLVILNEHAPSYMQNMDDELHRQIRMIGLQSLIDKPGGVFVRRTDIMPPEDVILLKAVARVVLTAEKGTLNEQMKRRPKEDALPHLLVPLYLQRSYPQILPVIPPLEFFNGLGGFASGGREYMTILKDGESTPAPWINVISNSKNFGFFVSESGSSTTWAENSQENKLTPWSNDAVSDASGEIIYLRDEDTGEYWTPTPLPIREKGTYVVSHGQGYTRFDYSSRGIASELQMYVPLDASIKINCLRLKNNTRDKRRLSVTSYMEWVLGVSRTQTAAHIATTWDESTGLLTAKNAYSLDFNNRVAFFAMSEGVDSFTCDRKEFVGRNGNLSAPKALSRTQLSGQSGAGLDPCAALQKKIELEPGEEFEICFFLGQVDQVEEAHTLVRKYSRVSNRRMALDVLTTHWNEVLGTIEITTPDPAMNIMMNRWLLYQNLSCRYWGRSAFYQSGGAFGFRDQLQDVMAFVYAAPKLARDHILTAAAHQFVEGDVLHWWHPQSGKGVRTHFSDDLLWLAFVTSFYVKVTGDQSILAERVHFIEAPLLEAHQESVYLVPTPSMQSETLLEHCARALDRSLKTGEHGLPLMGAGDWNDGMNRVGQGGKGESVWVAWFLHATLEEFSKLLDDDQMARREAYQIHMQTLKASIEDQAWDGKWYRRAYFDDGTPLGSALSDECQIDSIAQSWAVLSGASERSRALKAMDAVDERLVSRRDKIIKLFTPPFDKSNVDPGYIRGYIPGVRENGGQYTHAAIWTMMAFAKLNDTDWACELFKMINPISHSSTRADVETYKVEPYVMAADVYGAEPHVGRGGWTWYTGSASWMYRGCLESLLGFKLSGNVLQITPCIPSHWAGFQIRYKYRTSSYFIQVTQRKAHPDSEKSIVELDGVKLESQEILLVDDGKHHEINVLY